MAITTKEIKAISTINANTPATVGFAITPSDVNFLENANARATHTRGIMVNVAGNVKMDFIGLVGAPVTLTLLAGVVYPFMVDRVWSTGTTATGIFGFR